MMRAAYAKTQNILKEHYDKLILVGDTLLAKEKIDGAQFEALMTNGKLPETEANSVDSQSDKAASETAGKHDEPLEKTKISFLLQTPFRQMISFQSLMNATLIRFRTKTIQMRNNILIVFRKNKV